MKANWTKKDADRYVELTAQHKALGKELSQLRERMKDTGFYTFHTSGALIIRRRDVEARTLVATLVRKVLSPQQIEDCSKTTTRVNFDIN